MTPSHFSHELAVVRERMHAARTAALSLALLAAVLLGARAAGVGVSARLANVTIVIAIFGVGASVGLRRVLAGARNRVYDDILLSGFRHVDGDGVRRRAAWLVCQRRRDQLARSLERMLEDVARGRLTPVPIQRGSVFHLRSELLAVIGLLRERAHAVRPGGMVLVLRLLGEGADSPLYRPTATVADLARALDSIRRELLPHELTLVPPVAAGRPDALAA